MTEFEFVETYSQLFCKSCPLKVSKNRAKFELKLQKPTGARKIWKQAQQTMTITINKDIQSIEIDIKNGKAAQAYAERVLGLKLISCFPGNLIAQ